jgi:threonine dehydrogenase-like Zn-dependent dehydrogenase
MEELLPPVLDATIEPGKVFDAVTDLADVPGAYRDMSDRKALKVLIQ